MSPAEDEATAREVERLRREHPGWSIWHFSRPAYRGGVFNADLNDAGGPRLAAGTADELRAAIKTVEEGAAGEPTREDQVKVLAALEREALLGMAVVPMLETSRPHVAVSAYEVCSERVFVENRHGAWAYVWGAGSHSAHPVGDPAGAVRRVWLSLGRRRRAELGRDGDA